ncbi:MAG TPA: glycosyl hydrolase [Bacteroidetes bacterium]|nr:glycosyl hydrolase [Bacteroidota bacterium]
MKKTSTLILTLILVFISADSLYAQRSRKQDKIVNDYTVFYKDLEYRHIGPFRGGRSAAVTGIPGDEKVFYQGASGGGVWKTTDAGVSWKNISDGYFGGTIGAVETARSDRNIIYASGGEVTVRGNVSHGYGIWKSLDAGETWTYTGLREGQYIPRLRVHPGNPDLVYAAVLGHLFGPNEERGIYRSKDGGATWEKILYVSEEAGACDLILDPSNPRIIYASTWRVRRTPYSLESGGEGSDLWKSTDGGDTWIKLTDNNGMPDKPLGIIGVSLSAANHKKIYALVEAKEGGLFVSEDAGENWRRVNDDRNLRQRAWYYTRIYADPNDENIVYVLNVGFHKSVDGGRTFETIRTPHGDHHDLWIDPLNSNVMIVADDGGAQVSQDGGTTWSTMMNQPTAQFYRVITDDHFPYRIYGAQQDNSTVRIKSRSLGFSGITEDNWETTAGGESGWIAPDPDNNDIVYGGSYGGYLERVNHETGEIRRIDIWPDNPMGWGADSLEQRFQWNFPIMFSRHDNNTLFAASNYLFKTTDEGQSWERISPDLTRNEKSKMGPSGGPITKDNTSVEYYGTIFSIAESAHEEGLIWCGSDDGLIHITRDGGLNWINVTPPADIMPEWTMINSLEADPYNSGGLYVAATSYRNDDYRPYLFKTTDYGETWEKIVAGIDNEHFTRVVRADPVRQGLLFSGTESGMYISFNDGESWFPFQLNLPVVPITDLAIKGNNLVVATQGRSFWIFDYLHILRDMNTSMSSENVLLFSPGDTYRVGGRQGGSLFAGQNPLPGAIVCFFLKNEPGEDDKVQVDFLDRNDNVIRSFRTDTKGLETGNHTIYENLEVRKGMNIISWDLSYPGALRVPGMILWGGYLDGPTAVPGQYRVRLTVNYEALESRFQVLPNPNSSCSIADLQEQFSFIISVRDKLTETHQAILDIKKLRSDIVDVESKLNNGDHGNILEMTKDIKKELTGIEEALYQTKNRSRQDPLNYPIRLGNKLAALNGVVATGDWKPTDQSYDVRDKLVAAINEELEKLKAIIDGRIPELNRMLDEEDIEYIRK